MKKHILASLLAGAALLGFVSCSDDNDSNPTVQQPESFVLNTPAYGGNLYDLANSDSIELTYSQPDYGYTAAVSYYTQVSLTNDWRTNDTSEDGEVVEFDKPKFVEIDGYSEKAKAGVSAADINTAIMKMGGYASESEMPDSTDLYLRVRATLSSGYECYSNVVKITVKAYYASLVSADPELWYLIGGCVGDGTWGNDGTGNIGTSIYPLCPIEGEEYDEKTGQGKLTYTGYFISSQGFKIIKTPGKWDNDEWGSSADGDITQPINKGDNGGTGGSDFKVPSDGYYTITLDTKSKSLSIVAASETPTEYSQMLITGDFNGWDVSDNAIAMTPVDTYEGAKNHVWKYELTTDVDTTVKFLTDSSWGTNWGGEGFPFGWGVGNGANIPVKAGSYTIIFNDVTGYYHFYSK